MAILDFESIDFTSRSPEQTERVGMRLGRLLQTGDVILLNGDLGAGKTTIIRGIAKGWGTIDPVTSPTFVLVNEYYRMDKSILFHMDAYRIGSIWEAEELDLDRMLREGVLLVEWAERIKDALPKECLIINMRWISDEQREIIIKPNGDHYKNILLSFRQNAFGV